MQILLYIVCTCCGFQSDLSDNPSEGMENALFSNKQMDKAIPSPEFSDTVNSKWSDFNWDLKNNINYMKIQITVRKMHWYLSIWQENLFRLCDNSDYAEFTVI